jgi:dipeptidyl-peptidase-4
MQMLNIRLLFAFYFISQFAVAQQNELTLEDIWLHGRYSPRGVSGFNSMQDGRFYSAQDDKENIIQYEFATGKIIDTIMRSAEVNISRFRYTFAKNEQLILLQSGFKSIYRHSYVADIHVYNRKTREVIKPVSDKVMLPEFSPDGNKLAYVKNNNLYMFNMVNNQEIQITTDGEINKIINGTTDWVYEEEFGLSKGFYWNADGTALVYYRFDESNVKEYSMTMYGDLYPEEYKYKYPKAGENNSVVQIYTFNLKTQTRQQMDIGTETDIYIPSVHITSVPNLLIIQRLNRLQNKLEFLYTDIFTGKSRVIYTEENKAYIDVPNVTFLNDGKSYIINSEKDGFNHLYQYDMSGKLIRQLTSGKWDVDVFYGVDEKRKLFFISTSEVNSTERYIYACSMDGKQKQQLTSNKGWNTASFNADYTFFMHTHSTINTPPMYALRDTRGRLVRVLEDNNVLLDRLKNMGIAGATFEPIANAYNEQLNLFMIKPPDFDSNKVYPMLMYVYGGPGHQLAINRWGGANYMWFQMLAQKGYIVVCADGRGTGFKGEAFKKVTYLQLGKYEIEDQLYLAKQLGSRPYIDASRIGMFGWSFGGYMSSLAITKGADVFKTAIAVAPVTNWRYYDNIYTERFMRKPQENGANYDDNSPINHVEKIKGNYLIIHGTADDNVHFQNAVEMVNAMVRKNVKFDSEFYPNANHGIGGGRTRLHLFERMTRYLIEKL